MGGLLKILTIPWVSKQQYEIASRAEREKFRQRSNIFLHSLARFAAHGIVKILLTEFQRHHAPKGAPPGMKTR
jgi:hypothetical protein